MRNTELLDKIDAAIAAKNLLSIPRRRLAGGKLTRESLQLYAAQYYRHVKRSPSTCGYLRRAPSDLCAILFWKISRKRKTLKTHTQNSGATLPLRWESMRKTSPAAPLYPAHKLLLRRSAKLWAIGR